MYVCVYFYCTNVVYVGVQKVKRIFHSFIHNLSGNVLLYLSCMEKATL